MIIDCEQGTPEWHAARCGRVTASRIGDLTATTKSGYSATRSNYAAELIAERLTLASADRYTNAAMQWGTEQEPNARESYALMNDVKIVQIGFATHPTITMAGASPDGLVGSDGLVEIKCPNTATHIETLLGSPVDGKYIKQMQWQMACCERQWCDFVSYDPRMPPDMQLHVQRFARDDGRIVDLETEVVLFLREVAAKVEGLVRKFRKDAA